MISLGDLQKLHYLEFKRIRKDIQHFFHRKGTFSINPLCKESREANKVTNAVKSVENKT